MQFVKKLIMTCFMRKSFNVSVVCSGRQGFLLLEWHIEYLGQDILAVRQ